MSKSQRTSTEFCPEWQSAIAAIHEVITTETRLRIPGTPFLTAAGVGFYGGVGVESGKQFVDRHGIPVRFKFGGVDGYHVLDVLQAGMNIEAEQKARKR